MSDAREQEEIVDARRIRVSRTTGSLALGPLTLAVFFWTSACAASFMAEIMFGLVTSSAQTMWLVTGARASSVGVLLLSLVLFLLPLPGVLIFTAAWWPSLRSAGEGPGRALSLLVPLALVAGGVCGATCAVHTLGL